MKRGELRKEKECLTGLKRSGVGAGSSAAPLVGRLFASLVDPLPHRLWGRCRELPLSDGLEGVSDGTLVYHLLPGASGMALIAAACRSWRRPAPSGAVRYLSRLVIQRAGGSLLEGVGRGREDKQEFSPV